MKVSTTTFALAAALGVAAHPSGFAHKNMHRHIEKRLDFVMNTKPQAPAADVNKAAVLPSPTAPLLLPSPAPPLQLPPALARNRSAAETPSVLQLPTLPSKVTSEPLATMAAT
jgi:hypothetical protein